MDVQIPQNVGVQILPRRWVSRWVLHFVGVQIPVFFCQKGQLSGVTKGAKFTRPIKGLDQKVGVQIPPSRAPSTRPIANRRPQQPYARPRAHAGACSPCASLRLQIVSLDNPQHGMAQRCALPSGAFRYPQVCQESPKSQAGPSSDANLPDNLASVVRHGNRTGLRTAKVLSATGLAYIR